MIGVNLEPEDKFYIHKTCCHCGNLVYPDENGKIHTLERSNAYKTSLDPICVSCLEKMITKTGMWEDKSFQGVRHE